MVGRRRREGFNEKRERLGAVEDPAVVLEAALRFLEPRQRSIGEVRRRLTRVGYREDLVEGAIARLVELGMLDDEAFARTWIESRDRARPRGERALRFELARKGIDRKTADEAIAEADARRDHPERGRARSGARGCWVATPALVGARRRTRGRGASVAYALLARAGFDPEIAAGAPSAAAIDSSNRCASDAGDAVRRNPARVTVVGYARDSCGGRSYAVSVAGTSLDARNTTRPAAHGRMGG